MKFSKNWLAEWVELPKATVELCEQLTNAGLEVDRYVPAAPEFSGVVVAQVTNVEPHPDAAKLQVCTVDDGEKLLKIVCGAKNVAPGIKVALAKIGAILPGNFKIKKAKLRGVLSEGMLCAEAELGLVEASVGIMHLPMDAPLGLNLRDYLQLNDDIIDVDLTPNRGDCLSIKGIAREVGVINQLPVSEVNVEPVVATISDSLTVNVKATEACPLFSARIIRGINIQATTPIWMQQKLLRAGLRCINPIVDVTNYVTLELGQPSHAFDLAKLKGDITVRFAQQDETIKTLAGDQIIFDDKTLVIADTKVPLDIAGIIGGMNSGVSDQTQDILLISAFINPLNIMGKARQYGIHTEASQRIERGVDPNIVVVALERATHLILEICGGQAAPIIEKKTEKYLPQRKTIILRRNQIKRILGIEIADDKVVDILQRLTMQVVPSETGWQVIPPTHRFDIVLEVDLIEELARIIGLQNIPSIPLKENLIMLPQLENKRSETALRQILVARGYQETLTYSFVNAKIEQLLTPDEEVIALQNPISKDASVMRTSIWANLVPAVLQNQKHQQMRTRLFEIGRVYQRDKDNRVTQPLKIAGVISDIRLPQQWTSATEKVDFYDIKADIEVLLPEAKFIAAEHPSLHPGQAAQVFLDKKAVGWVGMLHPKISQKLKLAVPVALFELDMAKIEQQILPQHQQISKFPAIRRDLAIIVAERVTFQQVYDIVSNSVGSLLAELNVFDIYKGSGIKPKHKSMALSLTLQHPERTLVDEEVANLMQTVCEQLQTAVQAELRE